MNVEDLVDGIHPSWASFAQEHRELLAQIVETLDSRLKSGEHISPQPDQILRALTYDRESVRVLIVGQDPYPTENHAVGLSFSTASHVRPLPRSLTNIFVELNDDLGVAIPESGDLSGWAEQGVMLLNRVLTVSVGAAGSHRGIGWENFTDAIVRSLVARDSPLVAILWGADAAAVTGLLANTPTITSAHPSPLSARRGFWGSAPFSAANNELVQRGAQPIRWSDMASAAELH